MCHLLCISLSLSLSLSLFRYTIFILINFNKVSCLCSLLHNVYWETNTFIFLIRKDNCLFLLFLNYLFDSHFIEIFLESKIRGKKEEEEKEREKIAINFRISYFLSDWHNSFAVHIPDVSPWCGKPSNAFCPKCIPVFSPGITIVLTMSRPSCVIPARRHGPIDADPSERKTP